MLILYCEIDEEIIKCLITKDDKYGQHCICHICPL